MASRERSVRHPAAFCPACGHVVYPADDSVDVCAGCGASGPLRVDPEGTVYTFTVVHAGAPDMATPYALGYVDFDRGVRAFGRLSVGDAEIGRRVVPTTGPDGLLFFERRGEGGES